jgi:hypothetical protein
VLLALAAGAAAAHAQDVTVKVGMVKSISSVATLTAIEKGYFKAFGIKVETEDLDTSANVIALLAQNRLQVVEGGISAGYFNALEKNLPITMVMDRVSSPLGHHLMLRPDLNGQITRFKDLKGRIIASNGQGSVSTYEVGKMLETDGLTIADVDVKVLPFNQMAIAFTNKAIDAAIVIPPFTSQFLDHGFAVSFKQPDDLVKPWPLTIAVAKPRAVAQLFHRLSARRSRLLPGLSRRSEPGRADPAPDPHRHRDPRGAAPPISLAGARSQRPHQCREHARHAGLVPREQVQQRAAAGGTAGRHVLCRLCSAKARAVRGREQGQQARGLPLRRGRGGI